MARVKVILHKRVVVRNRTWLKVLVTTAVLFAIFIGGGLAYTYFGPENKDAKKVVTEQKDLPKTVAAKEQSKDNAASVAILSLSTPVKPGENAQVLVRTNQRGNCKITVEYDKKPESDSGLVPKQADEYGSVTWTWTVNKAAPPGRWPVRVTCEYYGKTAIGGSDIQVLKPDDTTTPR
jgi:hypothetical protein